MGRYGYLCGSLRKRAEQAEYSCEKAALVDLAAQLESLEAKIKRFDSLVCGQRIGIDVRRTFSAIHFQYAEIVNINKHDLILKVFTCTVSGTPYEIYVKDFKTIEELVSTNERLSPKNSVFDTLPNVKK